MKYNCEYCGHQFKQKNDLQRHLTKKNGCIPVNKIMEKKEQQTTINGKVQELHSLFKTCLDILRNDAEHLIGDEALNELSYFLILKQVEKHIEDGSIDIYNLELYKDGVKKYGNEKFLKYLEYVKFSKLIEYVKIPEKESNIKKIFDEFLWKEVLSKHPKFEKVFEDGKKSFIKESTTIKKIVITLSSIDFNSYDYDILGEAYESIFVDAVFGAGGNKKSELGQFFTPLKVKKLLLKLVNPKLKDNGEIESVLDPASGTGGILNTIIKHFKQFEKTNQITSEELKKQLIKNIYGIEIKGKIYNLCLSNMLINTGEILPNVKCDDSIKKFHNIKIDNIIANPPFSVTIKYDELLTSLGSLEILDDYIPIKTGGKNSEVLFLQMMIHCLNINGRCATVMLDGGKIYNSTSGYDKVREYLMKSCNLHEVILCPSGTFTSTSSKTCILFFTKKKERKDVVEISGKKRILKFCESHSTKTVKFYDFNPDTEEKHFIKEVNINEIASKKYSLNYTEYGIEEEEISDEEDIEWTELSEVCDIQIGGTPRRDNPEFYGGNNLWVSVRELNNNIINDTKEHITDIGVEQSNVKLIPENTVLYSFKLSIGKIAITGKPLYTNEAIAGLLIKNKKELLTKYLYYALCFINTFSSKGCIGNGSLNKTSLGKVKIPIPSLERQQKIVEFLDKLFTNKYNLQSVIKYYENNDIFRLLLDEKYDIFEKFVEWQDQSIELSKQIEFFKNKQTKYLYLVSQTENTLKKLGEVCNVNQGTYITKDMKIQGNYPVYGGGNISSYINQYNREDEIIVAKDGVSVDCVRYEKNKFFLNHHAWTIICKDEIIKKFMFYYLQTIQSELLSIAKGTAQLGINQENFYKIKIPIPSLERQQEIVEYCEYNDKLIKQLEKEIENNKNQAKLFINSIGKKHTGRSLVQNTTVNDSNEESDHNTTEDHLLDTDVENPIIEQNIYHEEITEVDELITKESDEDSD